MRGEILFLKRFYFSKQSASSNISRIFSLRFRIFLFLMVIFGVLGLRCGERPSPVAAGGGCSLAEPVAVLVLVEAGLWVLGLWHLWHAGSVLVTPALAGGFLTTVPPGESQECLWEGWLAFSGGWDGCHYAPQCLWVCPGLFPRVSREDVMGVPYSLCVFI